MSQTSFDATASARAAVLADLIPGAVTRDIALVTAYAATIGVSAQLAFPLPWTPVPVTGQTFAVLLGAVVLGSWRAAAGSGLYLAGGLVGVPWFAPIGGASFGYIIGFILAAAIVGWLAERGWDRTPLRVAGNMAVGNVVIYAIGATYFAVVTGSGPAVVLTGAVLPFIPLDLVKIGLATALVPGTWKAVETVRGRRQR